MILRSYQQEMVDGASRALKVHRRVLLQSPTGSGKTQIAAHMMRGCVAAGWRIWFVCHRDELIQQTSKTLIRNGVDHSFIAAGYPRDLNAQVQIGMVGTIGRRIEQLQPPKIIYLDEAHHAAAGTWRTIVERFPDALIVGLTASPTRLDGRGLDDIFNALVPGPEVRWLMDEGYLSDYRAWSHSPPDLSALKMRGADYDPTALAEKMTDAALIGDAVEHYLRICPGERAVSFCVNVEHALAVRDAFRAAGVSAEELDGNSPKDVRRDVLARFRAGEIDVLTSVDLFGEGFDLPEVSVAILQRPTQSLALFVQQVGRVLRPVYADGYDLETCAGRLSAIANGPKSCIARGTKILTPRGLVNIENITADDLVWDGVNWVKHEGAVCNGIRNVITYAGITLTPDHLVWTKEGWQEAGVCASEQIPIAQTGFGGREIRLGDNLFAGGAVGRQNAKPEASCLHSMRRLLSRAVDLVLEFATGAHGGMQDMQPAYSISEVALHSNAKRAATMPQSERSWLSQLWRSRDYLRLCIASRNGPLGAGESWDSSRTRAGGDRPNRQRSWLRSWKSSLVHERAESSARSRRAVIAVDASLSDGTSRNPVRRSNAAKIHPQRDVFRGDRREVSSSFGQAQGEVWDLVNAGPLHRFTANGVLVHNCATILDHAGNISRHGLPDTKREWTLEGRKKRASASSGPAPKNCPRCFGANPSGTTTCRYCGFQFQLTPREIETIAGDLVEIQREQARVAVASQTANDARSYDEVVTIMIARGHNDPATAAEAVWRKRGEPVTEQQFYDACKRVSHERRYKNGWAEFRVRMRRDRIKALAEKQKNKVEAA